MTMAKRTASIERNTAETTVNVELGIDGKGMHRVTTGIRAFDHMLTQLAQHGLFDLRISAAGDDSHHVIEDVAICLGRAFGDALGDKQGLVRMAHAIVPMDDALVMVAVDISGRGYSMVDVPFDGQPIGELPCDLIRHFIETFAAEARINLHAKVLSGINNHHKAEALFKAMARALDNASSIDKRIENRIPSTKDILDG